MTPSFITAIRSDMVSASFWSCVTYTNVMPTSRWMRFSSTCMACRSLRSRAPERLVQQQRLGVIDQRPGQRDPLLLATGQLARPPLLPAGQVHDVQHLANLPVDPVLGHALAAQPEGHVLEHAHVREQRVGLEHHVHVALVRRVPGDVPAIQPHRAAGRLLEPGRPSASSWSCRSPRGRAGRRTHRSGWPGRGPGRR